MASQFPRMTEGAQREVVQRLEAVLELVRSDREDMPSPDCPPIPCGQRDLAITEAAKSLYRARRRRNRYFEALGGEFGEPMWDVILDLFIAGREQRRVSISSACIAADVPSTTALRWLQHMEVEAIVVRDPDPHDRRRSHLRLSQSMAKAMEGYITELVFNDGTG